MKIGLAFKKRGTQLEDVTAFSEEYTISISRPDGHGLTEAEAIAVLGSYVTGNKELMKSIK